MNHIDSRIKSKGPKTTDMSNKFQNIGQSSMSMIRTNIGLDSARKKEIKNTNSESARNSGKNYGTDKDIKNVGNINSINKCEKNKDNNKESQSARININNNKNK